MCRFVALCTVQCGAPFALRPCDPVSLHAIMRDVDAAIDDGVNERTAKGERSALNK